jgi:predicted nucleic acid-binding protein
MRLDKLPDGVTVFVDASRWARQNYGLMANDSLIIAFMHKHRIRHLITNDSDFEQIPDIKVWLPR